MKGISKVRRIGLTIAGLSAMAVAPLASAYEYNYLEGGYLNRDQPQDEDGFRAQGVFDIASPLAIIAEYADVDYFSQFSIGGLYHMALQRGLDLNLGVTYEHVDIDPGDSDGGYGLRAGLRWMLPNTPLELNPELRYVDFGPGDGTSVRLGLVYPLAYRWDLQGGVQGGDDDRFDIGVRYNFGPGGGR